MHIFSVGMGHVYGVLPITTAKVPILKCVDRGTGVECDISVENRDGISKSQIIRIISSIDERFKKLSFLVRHLFVIMVLCHLMFQFYFFTSIFKLCYFSFYFIINLGLRLCDGVKRLKLVQKGALFC